MAIPDNSSSLRVLGVGGIAVQEVGGVACLIMLPADELHYVSV